MGYNKMKMFSILLITLLLMPIVLADMTVKTIDIPIGFGSSIPANLSVFKTSPLNLPDRVSQVLYAVDKLTGDYAPNTNLTAIMNVSGILINCSPIITTPNATVYNYHVEFDCTSALTNFTAGNVTFGFRGSQTVKNVFGSLSLTYYNNPFGTLTLSGTEYTPGDPATLFVQLKDNNGLAVQNGACFIDIWYPANGSLIHPYTINDAPMLQALGDDGIYYYDLTAPSQLGVYMLSARCAYAYNWIWIYPPSELVYGPIRGAILGTWNGATQNLNNPEDGAYDSCATSGSSTCSANYTFNVTQYGNISNITSIGLYYLGESTAAKVLSFSYWNGTVFAALPNNLTFIATGSTTAPSGLDSLQTNTIPSTAIINGTVRVQISIVFTGTSTLWNNWLSLALLSSTGTIQDVKGSSEMHITNIPNASATASASTIPAAVWNFTTRNLTFYNMTDTTNYSRISNLTASDVWSAATRNLTYYAPATVDTNAVAIAVWNFTTRNLTFYQNFTQPQTDLTNYTLITNNVWSYINRTLTSAPENTSAIANAVWNFTTRNLTFYPTQTDMTNYSNIFTGVWNYSIRNLTYYPPQTDLTNYTLINQGVWSYINRNLTYYQNFSAPQQDLTNYTLITQNVWNYITRTLTAAPENTTAIANAVWSATNRNLTYYPTQTDMTNYTLVGLYVWNATNRNLTYYPAQTDQTNYTLINNGVSAAVWVYNTRNLTYYPAQIDMTNYSRISNLTAADVWMYATRNLTYYQNFTQPQQDLTNYSKISNITAFDVWNYIVRNLTYYPLQQDLTNYTLINQGVWSYINRNLTYYQNFSTPQQDLTNYTLITESVWNYVTRTLTNSPENITAIANAVWSTSTRNLTYYPAQTDLTNYTLIGLYVWNVSTRNLTYYPAQTDLTNYSLIDSGVSTAVWIYINRNLTYYPTPSIDNNAVAFAVWNYTTRNLTFYPTQQDLTNYTLINQGVWSYTDRNLTYYPPQQDLTNYSLINSGVWTYTNRNLTFYPTQQDLTNYSLIFNGVWTYIDRNLTYYPPQQDLTNYSLIGFNVWNYSVRELTYYQINNITTADIWNYINRTLTFYQINNISTSDVWQYSNRTLTFYPTQQDLTNYTMIWEYPERNLTYYPITTINTTEISEDVWNYSARYTHGVILK